MKRLAAIGLVAIMVSGAPALAQSDGATEATELPTPAESLEKGKDAASRQSWRSARIYYKQACDGGEAVGCSGLADLYRKGLGGPLLESSAERLYKKACRSDDINACATLGYLFNTGFNGEPDYEQSRRYYKLACDADLTSACAAYGNQLYGGVGGGYKRAEGKALLQATCDDGFEWSCTRLVDLGFSKRDPF